MRFSASGAAIRSRACLGWTFLGCAVSLAAVAAACGSAPSAEEPATGGGDAGPTPSPDGGGGSPPGTFVTTGDGSMSTVIASGLQFDPPEATVTLDGTNPQTITFQLQASVGGGPMQAVAPTSIQFDRPDLATVAI